ncbi:helix-turn-helix transcriptional regulator [Nocardiopsis sp. MG754419]|uniref:helix-turn-helix domain-containing protein n=1 Tax=Nocardiopsis sp. MG754419 TaxID=2259865 RepID=UPI001BA58A41|nr:helix-turn-helix transcriptional regulator [Nocardiopsis sp. MG754419]MBR8741447.1 XRE family transcriptional regulator [Nocardiopsis sp. MG754419]
MGSSDSARQRFGKLLLKYRGLSGMTQKELARAAAIAQSTISDLESGKKGTRRSHIEQIDAALNANGVLLNSWDAMFSPTGMIGYFREVAEDEQVAVEIREYALGLVPGLVQVEQYARAISQLASPYDQPAKIDQIVQARLFRQQILDREHPPMMVVLLDESVLLRRFSNPHVMPAQIDHLVKLSHRPRITVQVIPEATEDHVGLNGSFRLSTAPDSNPVAYVESQKTGMTLRGPEIVASYERTFADLRSSALPVAASRSRMEEIRGSIT